MIVLKIKCLECRTTNEIKADPVMDITKAADLSKIIREELKKHSEHKHKVQVTKMDEKGETRKYGYSFEKGGFCVKPVRVP